MSLRDTNNFLSTDWSYNITAPTMAWTRLIPVTFILELVTYSVATCTLAP